MRNGVRFCHPPVRDRQWTTPYDDVPPTQNQPPQWPSYPPSPPTWDKSQNRSWNGLAIASFVLGILPGSLIAVGLGIGALVQIGRGGGKGRWMAIVGIALGALWTVFPTIGIVADAQDNEPTPPGAVKRDVTTLKAGDCTEATPTAGCWTYRSLTAPSRAARSCTPC